MDDLDQATRALVGTSKRDPSASQASDPRSTTELVALYLNNPETHEAGQALGTVQYRGGKEEFEIAAQLAQSNLAQERRVAADVLAQLGWQDRTYLSGSIEILLRLLDDRETAVLQAAAIACGHRKSPLSVARLVELAAHPSNEVRYGVSYGLAGQDEPAAIAALVLLSKDQDRDVRDWATFALGSQTDLDTSELREALRARLTDDDPEIRGEALVGLSRRHDEHLKNAVLDELSGEFHGDWAFEAAEAMADPEFIPALEGMRARMSADLPERFFVRLDVALMACQQTRASDRGRGQA
ncbi:MAG: HEAT repeat domain-containing protein [Steroidobacteraceae bacterium]